eukprot:6365495-Ditylum_brightwellii.AAC.1
MSAAGATYCIMATKEGNATCCTPSAWELQQEDHESYSPSGIDTIVGSEKAPVYYIESLSASNKAIVIFPDMYVSFLLGIFASYITCP